jgi:hypothetical protein
MLQRSLKMPFCKRTEGVFRIGQWQHGVVVNIGPCFTN